MKIAVAPVALLLGVLQPVAGDSLAQTKTQIEDDSYLYIHREPTVWPSPESVLRDLRSSSDDVRLKALKLAGLTDKQSHRAVWVSVNGGPAKVIGDAVIVPDRVQLTYAALGQDPSEAAIVAFEVRSLQATYAAIAVRTRQRWERIAAMDCWRKYDMQPDQDMLGEFISLRPAPERSGEAKRHYELVTRSSGGGTGIYTQVEDHYRIFDNELRNVLQFVSRYYGANPTGPSPSTTLERRWFTTGPMGNDEWGGTLVQARAVFSTETLPVIEWELRSLLDLHFKNVSCTAYRWDETTFRYERINEMVPACDLPTKAAQ